MKILLIGEFSGLHENLRDGLIELGHEVTIASTGDGWKGFKPDIDLGNIYFRGSLAKMERALTPFLKLRNFKQYDVIQFINARTLNRLCNMMFIRKMKLVNNNIYALVAGKSAVTTKYCLENLPYSPYHIFPEERGYCDAMDCLVRGRLQKKYLNAEIRLLKHFKGIIPTSPSYAVSHEGVIPNLCNMIKMPINIKKHSLKKGERKTGRIKILYGLNRECDKGHFFIYGALKKLQETHGLCFDVEYVERLPYIEYLKSLDSCDILIDQCKSFEYGMNALIGLAKGKVVLSGAEQLILN